MLEILTKNKSGILKTILILLLAITADTTTESILLESIVPIDLTGYISNIFLLASLPFAIFFASLSDFHCRRKIMIFALTSLSLSSISIAFFHAYSAIWVAYIALAFKGIGGNVTPIALASLATIVSKKNFTISLAIAICAYSLGSWIPIYYRSLDHLPLLSAILSIASCFITIQWFSEKKFDNFGPKKTTFNIEKFIAFAKEDWRALLHFCAIPAVFLVLSGFIFSEISFYQLLLRGEILTKNDFYSNLSLKIGLGYYLGTGILCFFQKKNISDAKCLKIGLLLATISIIVPIIANQLHIKYNLFYHFSSFSFSSGFALFTPSIFSMLSKLRHINEQGKIYGLLDSTDTLAIIISTIYIKKSKLLSYNQVIQISSTILILSCILMLIFIKHTKNLKKGNEHQIKKRGPP